MTPSERRAVGSLSFIFGLRMLGLFMILPVFALYAEELSGVTPTLIGLAIGIYGLTQALLQIPFGMLSDRIGRKPVIAGGLLVFAIGSAVAASSETIHGVIIGRALQGSGAIAAAVMAMVADLTREEHRTKAMAFIGASIGGAFILAMVLGPALHSLIGLPGIFWLTAILALVGIGVLAFGVPTVGRHFHPDTELQPGRLRDVLKDGQLLRLDFSVLVLHMVLTASFVAVPLVLHQAGFSGENHWQIYLGVMVLSIVTMVPFIILAEVKRRVRGVFLGAIGVLVLTELGMALGQSSVWMMGVLLWLFFAAFNLLEATLPSWLSKLAPVEYKGTAMGVYSTSQFLGAFIGGAAGGWIFGHEGATGVFLMSAGFLGIWLILALGLRQPPYLSSEMVRVGVMDDSAARALADQLAAVTGVARVTVIGADGVAYLKVDKRLLDRDELLRFSA